MAVCFTGALGLSLLLSATASAQEATAAPSVNPTAKRFLHEGNLRAEKDLNGAVESYQNAITADAKFAPAHYNLAIVYERQSKYAEAAKSYQAAIVANDAYLAAVENLANLALRQSQPKKAEKILLGSIRRHPADLGLRNRLIAVWLASEKISAAETEAKKILKADEKNIGALVNLASVFYRRGQYELDLQLVLWSQQWLGDCQFGWHIYLRSNCKFQRQ